MKTRGFGHVVALGCLCAPTLAQVPRPDFYVWLYHTPQEVSVTSGACVTPDLTRFTLLDGYNWSDVGINASGALQNYIAPGPLLPEVAARQAAKDILERLDPSALAGTRIVVNGMVNESAISISRFGSDWLDQDKPDPTPETPPADDEYTGSNGRFYGASNDALCFFRLEDRLFNVFERGTHPTGFVLPQPSTRTGFANDDPDLGYNWYYTRTYRHPLCTNGYANAIAHTDDDNNPPPLKVWTRKFVEEYQSIQEHRASDGLSPLPDPGRIYMDSEPYFAVPGTVNDVFILQMLHDRVDENGLSYWSHPFHGVPGFPNGSGGYKTLKQLYEAERDRVNTTLPNDSPLRWPLDLDTNSDGDSDVEPLFNASDPRSMIPVTGPTDPDARDPRQRPFMMWYSRVSDVAKDAVLENCFHSVVRAAWPNCKVSNYQGTKMDGLSKPTSWFVDWDGLEDTGFGHVVPNTTLPRGYITPWGQGSSLAAIERYGWEPVSPYELKGLNGKWFVFPFENSANVDSPVMYQIAVNGNWLDGANRTWKLEGYPENGGSVYRRAQASQQPNLYLPEIPNGGGMPTGVRGHPLETITETFVRQARHAAESSIGTRGVDGHAALVPWLNFVTLRGGAFSTEEISREVTPAEMRRLMSMLRTKKLSEMILWPVAGKENFENDFDPNRWAEAALWWKETQEVIDQVYTPFVSDYARIKGTVPSTQTGTQWVPELPIRNVAAAEYTSVIPTTGDRIALRSVQVSPTNVTQATDLMVEFAGLNHFKSSTPSPVNNCTNVTREPSAYMITLEGTCIAEDHGLMDNLLGTIEAFDWSNYAWVAVRQIDPFEDDVTPFPSQAGTDGSSLGGQPTWTSPRYGNNEGDSPFRYTIASPESETAYPAWNTVDDVGMHYFRRIVDLEPGPAPSGGGAREFVNPDGKMRLRFIQTLAGSRVFTTRYDLLQVVPYPKQCVPGANGVICGGTVAIAESGFTSTVFDNAGTCKLATKDCVPVHDSEWNFDRDLANWPQEHESPEFLLNSRFSIPSGEGKQRAYCRFSQPVWTNAPPETSSNLNVQPYSVWYWVTNTNRWANVTQGMLVDISRSPTGAIREIVVSSRISSTFQAGYYQLELNVDPPAGSTPFGTERYALYCGGTSSSPGGVPITSTTGADGNQVVLYNFRLYPDCSGDGAIDPTDARCNLYAGNECWADLDDGNGTGYPDGGVDINDLIFFLACFEDGNLLGDLDEDGVEPHNPDGGTDINDLIYFLTHFEAGC